MLLRTPLLLALLLTTLATAAEPDRAALRAELGRIAAQADVLSQAFHLVHELAAPSVVSIHTREQYRVIDRLDLREEVREVEVGEGSGFVFHHDAAASYVVTNAHVVLQTDNRQNFLRGRNGKPVPYDRITVATNDNRQVDAEVVGVDVQTDLAVLKVGDPTLEPLSWGDSDPVRVGDWVLAEGFPFGKGYSATAGIVSATDRSTGIYSGVHGFEAFIQTDAAINPGNSGGPLFNLRGEVVGVNANIISPTGTNAGLGFAIPSNLARRVAEDLLDDGKLARPMIGVELRELAPDEASALGAPRINTLQIARVLPGSPAEAAGLAANDVITAINGAAIVSWQQFRSKVASARVGQQLEFMVWRAGKATAATVVPVAEDQLTSRLGVRWPGFGLLLGVDDQAGLAILHVESDSLAEQAGLTPGDRVLHERSTGPLQSLDDASALAERRELVINVLRDGRSLWLRLRR